MMEKPPPVDLRELLNKKILVQAKDGRVFRGILKQLDDYMNLLLENVEELQDGKLVARHKIVVTKGGNIRAITL